LLTLSHSKQILEITKIYTKEQKYNRTNSSFNYKLAIFRDICKRVELLEEVLLKALPTILKGLVQDYFYNNQLLKCSFKEVCSNLYNFFKGPRYYH